jgi:hypothetical protein
LVATELLLGAQGSTALLDGPAAVSPGAAPRLRAARVLPIGPDLVWVGDVADPARG